MAEEKRATDEYDSDESDEDFCPDAEAAAGVSEASTDDSCGEADETDTKTPKGNLNRQSKKGGKAKTQSKRTKGKRRSGAGKQDKDSDESCEDSEAESGEETAAAVSRRCTRQTNDESNEKSTLDKDALESDEDDKTRSDALWADFLSDVKPQAPSKSSKQTSNIDKAGVAVGSSTLKKPASNGSKHSESTTENCIASPQNKDSKKETKPLEEDLPKKITVTEIVDFAGEEVRVQKTVSADSIKENKDKIGKPMRGLPFGLKRQAASGSSGGSPGAGGLGSILNQLGKKKKISVLEKSQLDWNTFKQDEGIDEQLQTFNKGKDGYLERQDFLQRTDLRQFEIEKNLRQSRRNN